MNFKQRIMKNKIRRNTLALLPSNLVIDSASNHFYRIGLSLYKNNSLKRSRIYNPIIIFLILNLYMFRALIATQLPNNFDFVVIGDWPYYLGAKFHLNMSVASFQCLALINQIIHYLNYRKNIKPSYLKLFEMLSGLVSPQSLGLTNEEDINRLAKRSKLYFRLTDWMLKMLTISAYLLGLIPCGVDATLKQFIIFVIPWSIICGFAGHYASNFIVYQIIHFQIICYYLKIKLERVNKEIKLILEFKIRFNSTNVQQINKKLTSIYAEIKEYNDNYWAKFLFCVLVSMIFNLNMTSFKILFGKMDLFSRLMIIIYDILFMLLLLILTNTSASVNFEANKSYKLLNKLMIMTINQKITNTKQLKVFDKRLIFD